MLFFLSLLLYIWSVKTVSHSTFQYFAFCCGPLDLFCDVVIKFMSSVHCFSSSFVSASDGELTWQRFFNVAVLRIRIFQQGFRFTPFTLSCWTCAKHERYQSCCCRYPHLNEWKASSLGLTDAVAYWSSEVCLRSLSKCFMCGMSTENNTVRDMCEAAIPLVILNIRLQSKKDRKQNYIMAFVSICIWFHVYIKC